MESLVAEYKDLLEELVSKAESRKQKAEMQTEDRGKVERRKLQYMVSAERLAAAVVALAGDYGAFMLRNALALAVALDVEDGRLGFRSWRGGYRLLSLCQRINNA